MKKILKYTAVGLISLLLAVVIFFFWAKDSPLPNAAYTEVIQFGAAPHTTDDSVFSVLTYNIGYLSGMANNTTTQTDAAFYDKNLRTAAAALKSAKADLIAFQEIDFGAHRSHYVPQLDTLAKLLGYGYGAKAVNWDKRYVPFPYFPISAQFGRLISGQGYLSRFPIKKHRRIVLSRVPSHPFYYDAFYLDRLAEVIEVEISGRQVALINVHLEAFDKPTRSEQTTHIKALYEKYAAKIPTILLGDFNSEYLGNDNPTLKILDSLPNVLPACPTEKQGTKAAFTYSSGNPHQQIDYIFYDSTQFQLLDWQLLRSAGEASDHLPVKATFRFK